MSPSAVETTVLLVLASILGLLVGSFLNVVIYRLPKMLERQWAEECAEINGTPAAEQATFNLLLPRSRCGQCGHTIRWYENIPVLSYAVLRGKCASCGTAIGLRYPIVEILTGALFAYCAWRWGATATALVWSVFCASTLALALIDWDTTLLPDDITLPLLWLGLIAAALQLNPSVNLVDALWGAVCGYLYLWLIYWIFRLLFRKEGMGYGDFKLLAALGAWFGWQALIPITLIASLIGMLVWIVMKLTVGLREGVYIPFGPSLVGAGFVALFFGVAPLLRQLGL